MQGIDPKSMKDMAKLKNADEVDGFLRDMKAPGQEQEIKNEFKALKEVEVLKDMVERQSFVLHAMWLLLKEKGFTNEEFDKALKEAVLLEKRTDYKHTTTCPNCGKGLQSMENYPFTFKCFYCGTEVMGNPYKKYDGLDPYNPSYTDAETDAATDEEAAAAALAAEEAEIASAQEIISRSYEPYDVSQDLHFDDEET